MTLLLTTRCNLSCAYCPQRRGPPRDMDEKALDAAVGLVAASGHARPRLVLFGGEPLLAMPLVRRAVTLLRERARPGLAPDVRLVTNGLLLDEETASLLDDLGVSVELSCDGLGEAQERRGAGTSARLRSLLLRLAATRPAFLETRLTVRMTLDSGNVGSLSRAVAGLVELGVRDVRVAPVMTPDPGWDERSAARLDAELDRVAAIPLPPGGGIPFDPFRPALWAGSSASVAPCSLGAPDVLFVDVDGAVEPCGAFARSVHPSLPPLAEETRGPLGGPVVGEPSLPFALERRRRAAGSLAVRTAASSRRSPRGPCASCETLRECFVCPASTALAPEQDPSLVPAIQCDWNRLAARHRGDFLARLAAGRREPQRAGRSSSAAETSAVTPARIAGA